MRPGSARKSSGSRLKHIDIDVAARRGSIYCFDGPLNVAKGLRPLLVSKDNDRDSAVRKILLKTYVLVGRQEDIEAVLFRDGQQRAITEPVPSLLRCCGDLMTG